jgi:hypothetical protein
VTSTWPGFFIFIDENDHHSHIDFSSSTRPYREPSNCASCPKCFKWIADYRIAVLWAFTCAESDDQLMFLADGCVAVFEAVAIGILTFQKMVLNVS